jgi:DNA (cytosine-5)-methyltransferase 1
MLMSIPVVDIFAGPGGLAEGFASVRTRAGLTAFDVVLSVEKEKHAHRTLTLRKMMRSVGESATRAMFDSMANGLPPEALRTTYPRAYVDASARVLQLELGPQTQTAVAAAEARLGRRAPWVLIGGPPCQAYSLVGRARRRGLPNYVPEEDSRQTLYLEYLQMLADCEPAVFVMENVKGLLSSILAAQRLFDRIAADLTDPAKALRREGRTTRGRPRYTLYAFDSAGLRPSDNPYDFVVRAEQYGVPQARHRVIIIGVRDGIRVPSTFALQPVGGPVSVYQTLRGLPKLRSGISREDDSPYLWRELLKTMPTRRWHRCLPPELRAEITRAAKHVAVPRENRGAEFMISDNETYIFNHSTRSHIRADLERYFFAASYARVFSRSPLLRDFPMDLLPRHSNVAHAVQQGTFGDRFRVQLSNEPSTTVTSHIAKDGHYYIHFDARQCRSLTVREAARLQTFPDDYVFAGPRTAQYHQVGNAVPPVLAERIATAVLALVG